MAEWYLKKKDDEILQKRPPNRRVRDAHERTLVTRFGDITVNRQCYKDEHGAYHYLLGRPNQASLTEALSGTTVGI